VSMSGDGFSINKTECLAAHAVISSAANEIRRLLEEVEAEGRKLLAPDAWEGEAQQAYLARQRQWQADAQDVQAALMRINEGLQRAVYLYEGADRRGVQEIMNAGS